MLIRFWPKISVVAFMFSFVREFVELTYVIVLYADSYFKVESFFVSIFISLFLPLIPFFLFVVMYFVGRRIDLKNELPSVSLNLLLVCWLGSYLGKIIGYYLRGLYLPRLSVPSRFYVSSLFGSFLEGVQTYFFPSIAAIAIAYLRNKALNTQ